MSTQPREALHPALTGIVTSWIEKRKFGFILPDHSPDGLEIFVHISDCPGRRPLPINTRVKFRVELFGGRTKASQVEVCHE